MTKLTENDIEEFCIELLKEQGYEHLYGPDIAPDSDRPLRQSFEDVLLEDRLAEALARINPGIPHDVQREAINEIRRIQSPDLLTNNENFHRMLTEGVKLSYQKDGALRGDLLWLVDFANPENNDFVVSNQFVVVENGGSKRPDVVLFVNGLPLVVMELKNAVAENATIQSAYRQLQTYKAAIPGLFTYNAFLVISDGLEAKAGSLSAEPGRFMAWKTADGKREASQIVNQLGTLVKGMLDKATLLDLIRHFIVFEKSKIEDPKTGVAKIETVKKLAAYHQYYAVNKAVESTLRAAGYKKVDGRAVDSDRILQHSPEIHGLQSAHSRKYKDRKGGVVWHTQGSGKSLSMVFYAGKIVLALDNPTILVITDRNDLDDQLFATFAASRQLLRQEPVQARSKEHLKELLRVSSGGIIFTTIQKFQPDGEDAVYETLSERSNIVVIADEAHRTQYGFKARLVDVKDAQGKVTGKKLAYGFAKYMRDALPNASYLGFTGTPIESDDKDTRAVFGNYVDIYDIAQAVEDGATVRIYYESRLAKIRLTEEGQKLIEKIDQELERQEEAGLSLHGAKSKWTQLEALVGSQPRLRLLAEDIVAHFENRQLAMDGKGMIVSMSRRIAAALYERIVAIRPDWHSEELAKGRIKVVMTAASSDGPEISKHHTTKEERRVLANRMKDPEDELKLVVVCDMWLTGFDVPAMHTLYIDKPMKGHNLMQAIARVNRVYKDKQGGLVVDYLGIASDLKKALAFYADAGGKGDPAVLQEEAVRLMLEKLEVVSQMFHGFAYEDYFGADTSQKLNLILAAQDHILGLEDGKKRFVDEVLALSKAFSIALPHEAALDAKDEIAFFQAVKARLLKYNTNRNVIGDPGMETAIRQIIDQALVSDQVVDVFDAAGIRKPDISILSEDFLLELKGMEHKNLALEVLKKLLHEELRHRLRKNLVKSKSLMEMLENSINKYHNKVLTAAEVIDELIALSREIVKIDNEAQEMGLSDFEYAFYSAVANNQSARELMQDDDLRKLAVALTEEVRKNASIDWTIKDSVRARLRVSVKRTLRKYGYPPDMQKLATDMVLKQAELIATEITYAA